MKKLRKFVNSGLVSKHIICSICQEIFDEPVRLYCGHTFCKNCILSFKQYTNNCPICRADLKLKCECKNCIDTNNFNSKDLITLNIVNDLEVYCNNKGCPWIGHLSDLLNHLKNCVFDSSSISDYMKSILSEELKDTNREEKKVFDGDIEEKTSFNTNSTLSQRLYMKNPLLSQEVNNEKKVNKRDSIFDFICKFNKNESVVVENEDNKLHNIQRVENFVINNSKYNKEEIPLNQNEINKGNFYYILETLPCSNSQKLDKSNKLCSNYNFNNEHENPLLSINEHSREMENSESERNKILTQINKESKININLPITNCINDKENKGLLIFGIDKPNLNKSGIQVRDLFPKYISENIKSTKTNLNSLKQIIEEEEKISKELNAVNVISNCLIPLPLPNINSKKLFGGRNDFDPKPNLINNNSKKLCGARFDFELLKKLKEIKPKKGKFN